MKNSESKAEMIVKGAMASMRKWVAGLLLSISVILLTISLYFLMGFFVQENDRITSYSKSYRNFMQKKEDEPEEDASGDS